MKVLKAIGAAVALAAMAGAAWAGGGCGGCCGPAKDSNGFNCQNQCPLAQQASLKRSFGAEGCVAKDALAKLVQKNLAKI